MADQQVSEVTFRSGGKKSKFQAFKNVMDIISTVFDPTHFIWMGGEIVHKIAPQRPTR
jgi:hypothetical protein